MKLSDHLMTSSFTASEIACILNISDDELARLRERHSAARRDLPMHDDHPFPFFAVYELQSYLTDEVPDGDGSARHLPFDLMQRAESIIANKTSPDEAQEMRKSYELDLTTRLGE